MIGKTNAVIGGSGGGELHGAFIFVTVNDDSAIGISCELYMGDTLVDSQTVSNEYVALFAGIQTVGTYTAKIVIDGKEFVSDEIGITAEDIGDRNIVNSVIVLLAQLVNYTMLYDAGDECVDVTGGWGKTYTYDGSSYASATIYNNYIYLNTKRASGAGGVVAKVTQNKIDFSNYSKIGAVLEVTSTVLPYLNVYTGTDSSSTNYDGAGTLYAQASPSSTKKTMFSGTKDISTLSAATVGVGISHVGTTVTTYNAKMHNVFLLKADDINVLCTRANVTAPSTLAELVADADSITAILASKIAVKFMLMQCTGDFMVRFVASSTCLTLLESSPYKELIYANEHWAKFLAMVA